MSSREETKEQLKERSLIIRKNLGLVEQTRQMYSTYAPELTSSISRFDEIAESLASSKLRIAVLGEYSRGKSSILNALLGIEELPTAQEATTAINTFIYGLPEDRQQPFLKITFLDGKTEELPLLMNGDSTLSKWGTELEHDNKDARKEVDHIDLYIENDLLKNDLALIDTPGLETMHAHHAAITRTAIDSAHMAIWVQSVQQLGGNRTEWEFLRETLSKCFRKFITLINWWDLVLDPQDKRDREKTPKEREREKLDVVRSNFRKFNDLISPDAINVMISEDNLFGISAKWAQSEDPEKQERSGIDKLYKRISQIAANPDDRDEILYKPLQLLSSLQNTLQEILEDKLRELTNDDSLDKKRRDLESLKMEIKGLEQEKTQQIQDTREVTTRLCEKSVEEVEKDIIKPLDELKDRIESLVTPEYIDHLIRIHAEAIDLPPDVKEEFENIMNQLESVWQKQRADIEQRIQEINLEFTQKMNKYMAGLAQELAAINLTIPKLDIAYRPNFSQLEKYYAHRLELEQMYNSSQIEVDRLEGEMHQFRANDEAVKDAKEAVQRAEAMIQAQGSRPSPKIYYTKKQVSSGGWYSSPKYRDVKNVDESECRAYDARMKEYNALMANKEEEYKRIQQEEFAKRGERISRETAIRKHQRKMEKMERELEELKRRAEQAESQYAAQARETLLRSTSGQLQKYAQTLKKNAVTGVKELFQKNLEALKRCVEEQVMEKMAARQANLEETITIIQKGEKEIEENKLKLENGLAELQTLQNETGQALNSRVSR